MSELILTQPMAVTALLSRVTHSPVSGDLMALAITNDSRQVVLGSVFVAVIGSELDSTQFIKAALQQGAVSVWVDSNAELDLDSAALSHVIFIDSLNQNLSALAVKASGVNFEGVALVGVTGTNGKSTVCFLLAQGAQKLGYKTGVIGTLGAGELGNLKTTGLTTPDALSSVVHCQRLIEKGVNWIAMEVSSHGLVQYRVEAIPFDVAVVTNVSQDHLDYHETMGAYAEAKARLLTFDSVTNAVINADDDWSSLFEKTAVSAGKKVNGFGRTAKNLIIKNSVVVGKEQRIDMQYGADSTALSSTLMGDFNVSNLASCVAVFIVLGFPLQASCAALEQVNAPCGRMQLVDGNTSRAAVVIDYAHTPDALERALRALRPVCAGQLWLVFGCGGDRDKAKRKQMGQIAGQYADRVLITSDNPRNEDNSAIVDMIVAGVDAMHVGKISRENNRALAVKMAINGADADDWILIAGKGHEATQTVAGRVIEMSDHLLVANALGVSA